MNILKKTLASLFLMMALVSTSAMAAGASDAQVRAAGENTIAKMQEAVSLAEKGADKAEILAALGEVRQSQKEFRYEQTERLRQKAGDRLRVAREAVEKGDASATESLKATLDVYKEMMTVYSAAH